ncbi:MAG: dihydroneopterin aldolase [Muribaculaceae bacterium]|nr:dihydroneopterin aldolase [Muribaculaceae bacterium]
MITATIEINGLRLFGRHGVGAQERQVGNIFEVTAHLRYPLDDALDSDNLNHTLNYAEAIGIIKTEMQTPSDLIEHVAGRIRNALLRKFPQISGGMLRVAKITPPVTAELKNVAIRLEW